MSKKLKVLVLGCVVLFSISSAALAADVTLSLDVNGTRYDFALNREAGPVWSLSGNASAGVKNIALTGAVVVEGANARFGYFLGNALDNFNPVVHEFVIDTSTLVGTGFFKWLTPDGTEGALTVSPWGGAALSLPDTTPLGY